MEWTKKTLEELVRAKERESTTLEFKRAASLYNSFDKADSKHDDLSKDVSSMANSNGGIIIYGIQEYNSGQDKGRAECIDPIDNNKISEEWLEQVINSRITPRISNIRIVKIEVEDFKYVFVVDIPQSDTAHQAQDKRYYKRFNFQATAMEDWELKDIINRKNKPSINLSLTAYKESVLFNTVETNTIEIDILAHNKGMIAANYINCFIEIDRKARKYIYSKDLTIYDNHVLLTFSNKEEQIIKIGEQNVKLPSFYDPLLPLVYKTIGVIKVHKKFVEDDFDIVCKVATETTFNELKIKSSEIRLIEK